MTNIFHGERVRLRGVEDTDFEHFFAWEQDTDGSRMDYEIWFPTSTTSRREWTHSQAIMTGEGDIFRFMIETLEGVTVGSLNTHTINRRNGTFMYGLYIGAEHRGKGYASCAIKIVLRYFFSERDYQKVNAEVYAFNAASIRLHERFGFTLEGRLRRMIYTNGTHHDALIYGMTREEFAERYP
jgi:RimJ/RimL family protein N-acetyltransferase